MKKHPVLEELSAYIDGEARDPEQIARHLQQCEVCAKRHLQLLKVSAQVQSLPAPEESPAFLHRVLAETEALDAAAQARAQRWQYGWRQTALAMGMVLLLAGGGLMLWLTQAQQEFQGDTSHTAKQTTAEVVEAWQEDDAVVTALQTLLARGADMSLLETDEDTDALEMTSTLTSQTEAVSLDSVVQSLADTADALETLQTSPMLLADEDAFVQITALDDETDAAFRALVVEYYDVEPDNEEDWG